MSVLLILMKNEKKNTLAISKKQAGLLLAKTSQITLPSTIYFQIGPIMSPQCAFTTTATFTALFMVYPYKRKKSNN